MDERRMRVFSATTALLVSLLAYGLLIAAAHTTGGPLADMQSKTESANTECKP